MYKNKKQTNLGRVALSYNSSHEFEVSLGYTVRSRLARTRMRPCLKTSRCTTSKQPVAMSLISSSSSFKTNQLSPLSCTLTVSVISRQTVVSAPPQLWGAEVTGAHYQSQEGWMMNKVKMGSGVPVPVSQGISTRGEQFPSSSNPLHLLLNRYAALLGEGLVLFDKMHV